MRTYTIAVLLLLSVGCDDDDSGAVATGNGSAAVGQCQDPKLIRYTIEYSDNSAEGCPNMPTQPAVLGAEWPDCQTTYAFNAATCTASTRRTCPTYATSVEARVVSADAIEGTATFEYNGTVCEYQVRGERLTDEDAAVKP